MDKEVEFEVLIGKKITKVDGIIEGSTQIVFFLDDGSQIRLDHWQDCCEHVSVESVHGDVEDIIGSEILMAEESVSDAILEEDLDDLQKWTFYKIATIEGYVTIRWLGVSNGYYGVGVDTTLVSE